MLGFADLELSVAYYLAPPIALVLAAVIFQYVRRLTENMAAASAFRSRGFQLFDTILFNEKEAVIVGQNVWSTYLMTSTCPRHVFEVVPNDRLKFQKIAKVPAKLPSEE